VKGVDLALGGIAATESNPGVYGGYNVTAHNNVQPVQRRITDI
jgi:hypothetical protein